MFLHAAVQREEEEVDYMETMFCRGNEEMVRLLLTIKNLCVLYEIK